MNATRPVLLATAVVALVLAGTRLSAHCDTLDGPTVRDARLALGNLHTTLAGAGAHHAPDQAAPAAPAHAHEH